MPCVSPPDTHILCQDQNTIRNLKTYSEQDDLRREVIKKSTVFEDALSIIDKITNDSFTEDEYFDILDINSEGEYEINGQKIKATDLMEVFYDLFVTSK